jgi:hypothetical protein
MKILVFSAFKHFFSTEVKVINSHIKLPISEAQKANKIRSKQIIEYQRELAKTRRLHAQFARQFPTKAEREKEEKQRRGEMREATWTKYVEGLKRTLNPPIEELQESGKIPKVNFERRQEKASLGQVNFQRSIKSSVLMRRKYVNYLSTEVLPYLVTRDNLEAKINEALESTPVSHNFTAEMVVEREKEVKRKLKEIRVSMDEYEGLKISAED